MKINIGCGQDIREGFINLDYPTNTLPGVQHDTVESLDTVSNDSIEYGLASHILEKFQFAQIPEILKKWKSKFKKGAELVVEATDANVLGQLLYFDQVNLVDLNTILFTQNRIGSVCTISHMEKMLKDAGFEMLEKGLTGTSFYIRSRSI